MAEITVLPPQQQVDPALLIEHCDEYLANRSGYYRWRKVRYNAVIEIMKDSARQLLKDDIIVDWGAGGTEFDYCLRAEHGWRGRYWPLDGWMGTDLRGFELPRTVDWIVACEVIEHMAPGYIQQFLDMAWRKTTKGVVLTTPNPAVVDVFAMDATHVFAVTEHWLSRQHMTVEPAKLYGTDNDSLLAWRLH